MFNYNIKHQDSYSRGEAILRALFGYIYIGIPHIFCLFFVVIAAAALNYVAFFMILFTGKLPKFYFDFILGYFRWNTKLTSSLNGMVDGYPSFGFDLDEDKKIEYTLDYVEKYSRGQLLLVTFFSWLYVIIPHYFILFFRLIWGGILTWLAFWVVIFTGKYPAGWHKFNVATYRWIERVNQYIYFIRTEYPPFNGLPDNEQDDQ
jgi:hypothetical protein